MNGSTIPLKNLSSPAHLILRPTIKPKTPEDSANNAPGDAVSLSSATDRFKSKMKLWLGREGYLRQALLVSKSLGSGILSYSGFTHPAAKVRAEKGPQPQYETSPKFMAVLETPLQPGTAICPKEEKAYAALNASLTGQFKTLDQAFADPDAFRRDLESRFEAQKKKTPEDPYAFDFADYGLPVLQQVGQAIHKEVAEILAKPPGDAKEQAERATGVKFLNDIDKEIQERSKSGDLSYRRTQELSYAAACALGHFDMDKISPRDRFFLRIDSYLQSEDRVGIEEEYRRFKDGEFTVFQKPAHRVSGFDKVEKTFENAFFNPDRLEMVSLPTMEPLTLEPFTRLANKDIFLAGVAADPIPADGFVRQGRLFWLHDVRHNSAIFAKKKAYEDALGLSEEQKKKLDRRMDVWNVELTDAARKIKDPDLRSAVENLSFNFHHDRGLPFVPSTFDRKQLRPVTKALRFMWGVSGQNPQFDNPVKTQKQAYKWLTDFWRERREQESEIVNK